MLESFSVAVSLRLVDRVSPALVSLAGQFGHLQRGVLQAQGALTSFETRLKSIKTLALAGGALFGAGIAGLYAFKSPLAEAAAWQQEAAKFASLGFGAKVNTDAEQFARGLRTYGTSARENLALLGDAMSVFKNLDHAEFAAPLLAKMKFANEAVFGTEQGAANERSFLSMMKVIELRRGLSSESEFATQADYVQKAISGSRGRVDASQWLQLLKTGGVGVSQLSNQAFYLGLEPMVQEFGGSRTGTALMSIYQNLVQARGSLTSQRELYRLGLLDKDKVEFNSMGQLKKVLPGAFQGTDVYEAQGPMALLNKVLLPAFARLGITSESKVLDELGLILSNRTGSGFLGRMYQQSASIETQSQANLNAMGVTQLNGAAANTAQGKLIELSKKWRDVQLELGTAVLPLAIKGVQLLTVVIRAAVTVAREFPILTRGITIFGATLAGLAATGGGIMLVTASFRALGLALAVGKGLGLGAQLVSAAGGIGALSGSLGLLAARLIPLTAAAIAGYKFGEFLNGLGPNGDFGGWAEGKLGDWFHRNDQKYDVFHIANGHATRLSKEDAFDAVTPPDKRNIFPRDPRHFIARAAPPETPKFTVINKVDRNGLQTMILDGLGKKVGAPESGIAGFDGIMQLAPPGH